MLSEVFREDRSLFNPEYVEFLEEVFSASGIPGVFISARRLLEVGPFIFREDLRGIVLEELGRWEV